MIRAVSETKPRPEDAGALLRELVDILNYVVAGQAAPIAADTTVGDILADRGVSPGTLVETIEARYRIAALDQSLIRPDDTLRTMCWRVHAQITGEPDF